MKIKLDENTIMPTRAHDTDAGLDLYAREDKIVPAGGSATFDTGVHISPPFFDYQNWSMEEVYYYSIAKEIIHVWIMNK